MAPAASRCKRPAALTPVGLPSGARDSCTCLRVSRSALRPKIPGRRFRVETHVSTPHQSPFRSPFWRYGMAVLTVLLADLAVEVFVAGSLRPQSGVAALLQLGISVIVGVVAV